MTKQDKFFEGYKPDFLSEYGEKQVREWQEDMKRVENFKYLQTLVNGIRPIFHGELSSPPEPVEYALEYWLQQYKELEWNNDNLLSRVHEAESTAAAEKERADQEKRNHKTVRSMLNNEQVAHSITKDREKKLRDEIDGTIPLLESAGLLTRASCLKILLESLYPEEEEVNE